jgi:hypothetical protein
MTDKQRQMWVESVSRRGPLIIGLNNVAKNQELLGSNYTSIRETLEGTTNGLVRLDEN